MRYPSLGCRTPGATVHPSISCSAQSGQELQGKRDPASCRDTGQGAGTPLRQDSEGIPLALPGNRRCSRSKLCQVQQFLLQSPQFIKVPDNPLSFSRSDRRTEWRASVGTALLPACSKFTFTAPTGMQLWFQATGSNPASRSACPVMLGSHHK